MKKYLVVVMSIFLAGSAFAYDYVDAVRQTTSDSKGVEASMVLVKYLQDVLTITEADNEAEEYFMELVESLGNFSFQRLYNNEYYSDWPSGYRGISFKANFVPGKYDFRVVPHDRTLKDRSELSGVGAFICEFALKKNDNSPICGNSYSLLFEGDATSAGLSHENLIRLFDNLIRISDPDNLDLLKERSGAPADEPYDVLTLYKETFPKFSTLDGVVDMRYAPHFFEEDGLRFNYFTFVVGLHQDRLDESYPHLGKYVKKLKQPGYLQFTHRNTQGNILATTNIDLERQEVRFSHCTREGKVVPYKLRGEEVTPYWSEAYSLTSLETNTWDYHFEMLSVAKGIRVKLDDVIIRGQYDYNQEDMSFSQTLSSLPKSRVTGAVFGIIPLPLIDVFIPGTIQGMADEFSQVVYKANYGAGSFLNIDWHMANPSQWWGHWRAETEMPDSGIVQMGLRWVAKRYKMNSKTQEDAFRLAVISLQYLMEELEAMKE